MDYLKRQWQGAPSRDDIFFIDTKGYDGDHKFAADCFDPFNCDKDGPFLYIYSSAVILILFIIWIITVCCGCPKSIQNCITVFVEVLSLGVLAGLLTLGLLDYFTWITLSPLLAVTSLFILTVVVVACKGE